MAGEPAGDGVLEALERSYKTTDVASGLGRKRHHPWRKLSEPEGTSQVDINQQMPSAPEELISQALRAAIDSAGGDPGDPDDDDLFASDGESSGDDSQESSEGDPPVYAVECKACRRALSQRGMAVFLIAKPTTGLYSTDIPSEGNHREVGEPEQIDTCECLIRRLECAGCSAEVGYHVTRPCEACCLHDHNGHFWLFKAAAVEASKRECRPASEAEGAATLLTWSMMSYNGAEASDEPLEEGERCAICYCPIQQRTRLPCAHEFCFGCVSREVDARGRCPLDRLPLTRAMLERVDADR